MKKIALFLLPIFFLAAGPAIGAHSPFFGDSARQVALHVGAGVNSGFIVPPPLQFVPFSVIQLQYSLPSTFFEMPARHSINIATTAGWDKKYGWDWPDYSIPIAMLSEDVALLHGERWYLGAGGGVGMQAKQNKRIGSKLVFQFKVLAGYKISDSVNLEAFAQHFSNGTTAPDNHSYGFYGLGFAYNF
jgi:hypothetical protein